MCSTGRPFDAPIHPATPYRIALPALLALAIWAGLAADHAYAQGFGVFHGRTGNTGFSAANKGTLVPKASRPATTSFSVSKANSGGTIKAVGPTTTKVATHIPSGSNGRPLRPRPHGPIVTPKLPILPAIPVITTPGDPTGVSSLAAQPNGNGNGNNSGPSGQIVRRPGTGVPPANERNYVSDEVVIELSATTADQTAEELARLHRLTTVESFEFRAAGTKLYRWRITDRRAVPDVVRELERSPGVISASANYIARLQQDGTETVGVAQPNRTPLDQYAVAKLQLPQAHAIARGENVLVAIVDGGVDTTHPELAGVVVETFDAIGSGDAVHPHGTAVAGAIAAQVRLKGSAPAAQILAARAFGAESTGLEGTAFSINKAIDWAISRNAKVINLSFVMPHDRIVELSLRRAREQGIILVAAAGNDGPKSPPRYPASDANVIAVTATDQADKLFAAAVRGKHIAVAAPGVDLLLPGLQGTYQQVSGTSFSAAEVSGTVALLLERRPGLDLEMVRYTLMSTARPLGRHRIDIEFGAGLVDAHKALMALSSSALSADVRGPR